MPYEESTCPWNKQMPRYEFCCPACGVRFDLRTTVADRDSLVGVRCLCGHGRFERVPTAPRLPVSGIDPGV